MVGPIPTQGVGRSCTQCTLNAEIVQCALQGREGVGGGGGLAAGPAVVARFCFCLNSLCISRGPAGVVELTLGGLTALTYHYCDDKSTNDSASRCDDPNLKAPRAGWLFVHREGCRTFADSDASTEKAWRCQGIQSETPTLACHESCDI